MRKSTAILLLTLVIAILGGVGWYLYSTKVAPETDIFEGNPFEGFNPFGNSGNTTVPTQPTTQNGTTTPIINPPVQVKLPRLRQLSAVPVAGAMASTTASSTIVRYVDRGVGHIYETKLTEADSQKLTNTTIPRVYSAVWNKQGNSVILSYIKEGTAIVSNFYADIIPPVQIKTPAVTTASSTASSAINTTPIIQNTIGELRGRFFPSNILNLAVSPKGDRVFILSEDNGGSIGYVSRFSGETRTQVFSSPLTQLNIDWNTEDTIIITTKSTYAGVGLAYIIDLKKGTTEKILGPLRTLSTLTSTDGSHIFYSSLQSSGIIIPNIYSVKDRSVQDVVFRTLPEKCVWSKKNPSIIFCAVPTDMRFANLPDSWYQGKVSFADNIWELDIATGEVKQLSNLYNEANKAIDAINLFLDPKEEYLVFTNKRDLTLWSLDIRE